MQEKLQIWVNCENCNNIFTNGQIDFKFHKQVKDAMYFNMENRYFIYSYESRGGLYAHFKIFFLTYSLNYVLKLTYKLYCPKLTDETYHSEEFLFVVLLTILQFI